MWYWWYSLCSATWPEDRHSLVDILYIMHVTDWWFNFMAWTVLTSAVVGIYLFHKKLILISGMDAGRGDVMYMFINFHCLPLLHVHSTWWLHSSYPSTSDLHQRSRSDVHNCLHLQWWCGGANWIIHGHIELYRPCCSTSTTKYQCYYLWFNW